MKSVLLCFSILLFGLVSQAQSHTASLNITLTDLQSIKFGNSTADNVKQNKQGHDQIGSLQVLNQSTSQIKQIDSKNSNYARLYQELYSRESTHFLLAEGSSLFNLAAGRPLSAKIPPTPNKTNLIIYEVNPR